MKSNKAQLAAPAFRLPALDQDFLLGDSTRGLRFQLEYQKAEEYLRKWGVASTVVVFGSARIREGNGSGWYETGARTGGADFRARWRQAQSYRPAPECDRHRRRARHHGSGQSRRARRRRALDRLQHHAADEQEPNAYSTPELTFRFHYFAMRKMHLAMRATALVVFPGGFGTFDELFEILTLRQTGKMEIELPIVLFDKAFWHEVVDFDHLAEAGMVEAADLSLFDFAE